MVTAWYIISLLYGIALIYYIISSRKYTSHNYELIEQYYLIIDKTNFKNLLIDGKLLNTIKHKMNYYPADVYHGGKAPKAPIIDTENKFKLYLNLIKYSFHKVYNQSNEEYKYSMIKEFKKIMDILKK